MRPMHNAVRTLLLPIERNRFFSQREDERENFIDVVPEQEEVVPG